MKKLLLLFIVLTAPLLSAHNKMPWYFLPIKKTLQVSIANPILIMTQEAIDRKTLQNTPIDERDVPVNEDYITQIKNTPGITVHAKSKWMNYAYVRVLNPILKIC